MEYIKKIILLGCVIGMLAGCVRENNNKTDNSNQNSTSDNNSETEVAIKHPKTSSQKAEDMLNEMTLEEKVAQLFIVDIDSLNEGVTVVNINNKIEGLLEDYPVGGVIFFSNNIIDISQTNNLINDLQKKSNLPLFVSVDEEGGIVSRIANNENMHATVLPGNEVIGKTGDTENAYKVGQILGKELKALGFNMNFAPVADVNTNPNNPIIGPRAFGSDPEKVGNMVAKMVEGIQNESVSAVLKHFPGHGDTSTDTHKETVYVDHNIERLREIEFAPFKMGMDANVDAIMTAHISMPNVTDDNLPATMSKQIITDILRDELDYEGLIITDALNMKAISDYYSMGEAAVNAIDAGCDVLLMPIPFTEAYDSILQAVSSGDITEERINESVRRILKVKYKLGLFSEEEFALDTEEVLGSEEHNAIVEEIKSMVE
ncbi:MAG: beta-N-acetylhexosaminidase [Eubacteriales bacterium]